MKETSLENRKASQLRFTDLAPWYRRCHEPLFGTVTDYMRTPMNSAIHRTVTAMSIAMDSLVTPTPPEGTPCREGRYQRHSQAKDMIRISQIRMTVASMFAGKGDDDVPK